MESIDVTEEELAEAFGVTVEELHSQLYDLLKRLMPSILRAMVAKNVINREKFDDRKYLWSVVKENIANVYPGLEQLIQIHQSFIEVAQYAIDKDKPHVAIILIATAVEHSLNLYYRELLTLKGLSQQEVTQVIKANNIQAKLGWLLSLSSQIEMPQNLRKAIDSLVELRNAIVHYKATPERADESKGSWGIIEEKLAALDLAELMVIPDELDYLLESHLNKLDDNRRLAIELAEIMFSDKE